MFVHVDMKTREAMITVNWIQNLTINTITPENTFPSLDRPTASIAG